jgi:hypothetical protein
MDEKRRLEEQRVLGELLEMAEELDAHGLLSLGEREMINTLCFDNSSKSPSV